MEHDETYMRMALEEARKAADRGEIPVGAVIADRNGTVLARAGNLCETERQPTHHAELLAVQAACRAVGSWRLSECTLYVTLEPCPMCMGAIIHARMARVVYGASDPRAGACGSLIDLASYPLEASPKTEGGVLETDCLKLLRDFFAKNRKKKEYGNQ